MQLERTALAKMHAMQDFAIKCYMDIFHPVQNARGQLEAFPHIIDTIAIASLLGAPCLRLSSRCLNRSLLASTGNLPCSCHQWEHVPLLL